MACSNCRRKKGSRIARTPTNPGNAVDFTVLVPKKDTIMGYDGKMKSIKTPLVRNKPKGGTWGVDVRINRNAVRVYKTSAEAVFTEVKRLYQINNIEIDDLTIWFNLNLIWVSGLSQRHVYVTESDLKSLL